MDQKILIEAWKLYFPHIKDGCYRYVQELVYALQKIVKEYENIKIELLIVDRIIPIEFYKEEDYFQSQFKKEIGTILKYIPLAKYAVQFYRLFYYAFKYKKMSEKPRHNSCDQYDLVHISIPALHDSLRKLFTDYKNKLIATILDLTTEILPQYHKNDNIESHNEGNQFICNKAHSIITISQSTKNDYVKLYSFSESKIFPILLGFNKNVFYPVKDPELIESTKNTFNIQEKYILSLGTLEPRKNLSSVVKAFNQWCSSFPNEKLSLVLIGRKGWKSGEIFDEINKNKKNIITTGFIEDQYLASLYSGALFFCYPSHYEGFGLPLLESMACGTPVIYGNNSSMPEIAEGSGLPVDSNNVQDIYEKMNELYQNDQLRKELSIKSLERAQQFSWEKCARETLDLYRKVLSE